MEEDEHVQKMPGPLTVTITPEAYGLNQQLQETLASSPGKLILSNGIVQGVKSMQVDRQTNSSDQKQGLFLVNKRKRENNLENRQFNIPETTVDDNTDNRIDSKVENISFHAIVKRNESITGGKSAQEKKQVEDSKNQEVSHVYIVNYDLFDLEKYQITQVKLPKLSEMKMNACR